MDYTEPYTLRDHFSINTYPLWDRLFKKTYVWWALFNKTYTLWNNLRNVYLLWKPILIKTHFPKNIYGTYIPSNGPLFTAKDTHPLLPSISLFVSRCPRPNSENGSILTMCAWRIVVALWEIRSQCMMLWAIDSRWSVFVWIHNICRRC